MSFLSGIGRNNAFPLLGGPAYHFQGAMWLAVSGRVGLVSWKFGNSKPPNKHGKKRLPFVMTLLFRDFVPYPQGVTGGSLRFHDTRPKRCEKFREVLTYYPSFIALKNG